MRLAGKQCEQVVRQLSLSVCFKKDGYTLSVVILGNLVQRNYAALVDLFMLSSSIFGSYPSVVDV